MHTELAPQYIDNPLAQDAQAVLRKCVHCGFCTATCPTYQLLGDELDGPRGRIYLIKQMLEGAPATAKTQTHLDRCLTCRNCETTCPSGVEYGKLIDIGRHLVDEQVPRPLAQQVVRSALKHGLTSPLFGPALKLGQWVRPLLPQVLKNKVPQIQRSDKNAHQDQIGKVATQTPESSQHSTSSTVQKTYLMPTGCVQPAMLPNIDRATQRVLAAAGLGVKHVSAASCCGAIAHHLNDEPRATAQMRANIDAWLPLLESGAVQGIVINASGCSLQVKEYAHVLRHDTAYAAKAQKISEATLDLSELLPDLVAALKPKITAKSATLAYHAPCTLQHGQKLKGGVEAQLQALGFTVSTAGADAHLCCGSAGTYSVLQPELSYALRDRKLAALQPEGKTCVVSANVGCISHLQSGTATPVKHWIELIDDALAN